MMINTGLVQLAATVGTKAVSIGATLRAGVALDNLMVHGRLRHVRSWRGHTRSH